MRLLDLGGGSHPHPQAEFVIDFLHPVNAPAQDATVTPWSNARGKIPDGHVDVVYASNVLEHIPAGQPRLDVLAEIHRVLRAGGLFVIKVPLVGYNLDGPHPVTDWRVWSEPTHVSSWWFPEGLMFFTACGLDYGYRQVTRFAKLGPYVSWNLALERFGPYGTADLAAGSWWSVWNDWEGVARLKKPT